MDSLKNICTASITCSCSAKHVFILWIYLLLSEGKVKWKRTIKTSFLCIFLEIQLFIMDFWISRVKKNNDSKRDSWQLPREEPKSWEEH